MFESLLGFIFQNYGVIGLTAFIVSITILKYGVQIKEWITYLTRGRIQFKEYDSKDILLSKINYWLEFKIDHIGISDAGRREIFKDLLKIKFKTFKKYIERSDELYTEDMSPHELYEMIMKCFHQSIEEYERLAVESGIPEIVIRKFHEWQTKTFEFTLKSTEMICYSHVYDSNKGKVQAIFNLFTAMMELTITEAEKTLTDLNGELTGIEYKGYICG